MLKQMTFSCPNEGTSLARISILCYLFPLEFCLKNRQYQSYLFYPSNYLVWWLFLVQEWSFMALLTDMIILGAYVPGWDKHVQSQTKLQQSILYMSKRLFFSLHSKHTKYLQANRAVKKTPIHTDSANVIFCPLLVLT